MTDIPTAPDNKPSNLQAILVKHFWHDVEDTDKIAEAVAAIEQYGREQRIDEVYRFSEAMINHSTPMLYRAKRIDELEAIDTTLRNFSGQTEGEGK